MSTALDIKEFSEMVRSLAKNFSVFDKFYASCCGISIAQCYAIYEIGVAEEISLNELARLLNLDTSTMSRTINNLVKEEIVERKEDKADRRFIKIQLTEKGNIFYKNISSQVESYYKKVLGAIPTDRRAQVVESLGLLAEALKKNKCCRQEDLRGGK